MINPNQPPMPGVSEFMKNPDTYHRAKWNILSWLVGPYREDYYEGMMFKMDSLRVGDLVVLQAAMPSKWHLSWMLEIQHDRWLLASVEDRSECWWSNVSFARVKPDKIHECWRWTDRQFAFNDRWRRVCGGHYCVRDGGVIFDGLTVKMKTRSAFDHNPEVNMERAFPDWRKVRVSDMRALYGESVSRLASNRKSA